jgi:hypothetical protein
MSVQIEITEDEPERSSLEELAR